LLWPFHWREPRQRPNVDALSRHPSIPGDHPMGLAPCIKAQPCESPPGRPWS
jgi:hypothetical protein